MSGMALSSSTRSMWAMEQSAVGGRQSAHTAGVYWTVRVALVLCALVPSEPVIVSVEIPVGVLRWVVIVKVDVPVPPAVRLTGFELNELLVLFGKPVTLRVTLPL